MNHACKAFHLNNVAKTEQVFLTGKASFRYSAPQRLSRVIDVGKMKIRPFCMNIKTGEFVLLLLWTIRFLCHRVIFNVIQVFQVERNYENFKSNIVLSIFDVCRMKICLIKKTNESSKIGTEGSKSITSFIQRHLFFLSVSVNDYYNVP